MRQTAVRMLRATRLLPLAERLRYWSAGVKHLRKNRAFVRGHPEEAVAPGFLMYDAYGEINYPSYFVKGSGAATYVVELAREYLGVRSGLSVCEWGCGPGRIIRHLPTLLPDSRIYGTDSNARTIAWCSAHLRGVTFRVNDLAPPLPFATGAMDLLYAVSVLTHLSEEMHIAWVAECRRVVRPGGLILLTVHGDRCAGHLSPSERAAYDAGHLVARGRVREGSRTFVAFQSPGFMRELLRGTEVLLHNPARRPPAFGGAQDMYLVRNGLADSAHRN
jgi:SAM-dependent methyltransferase